MLWSALHSTFSVFEELLGYGGKNQALTYSLSHCLVYGSMNSPTFSNVSMPSWKVRGVKEPFMALNANCASISNTQYWPFPKHIPFTKKAALDKRGIASKYCLHEEARGEIPSFVHSVKQGVSLLRQPPYLFSQHCEIESETPLYFYPSKCTTCPSWSSVNVQIVYKTPWTFRPPNYKLPIQAYYQTMYVQNMNISLKQNW